MVNEQVPRNMANSTVGQLTEFNLTKEWKIFKARVTNYFTANDIDDEGKQRAIFLNVLDEESYRLIFNLCAPTSPEETDYDALIVAMDSYFTPQKAVFAERIKFYEARKEISESVQEWGARVRSLAATCEFGASLEEATRDLFICGYERGATLNRLLEEEVTVTLDEVVKIAESKTAAQKSFNIPGIKNEVHMVKKNSSRRHQQIDFKAHGSKMAPPPDRGRPRVNERQREATCFVCGKQGHMKDKCYFQSYRCNICNRQGHLARMCSQKSHNAGKPVNYMKNDGDELALYNVFKKNSVNSPYFLSVKIENNCFEGQVDTGSSVSLISECLYREKFQVKPLEKRNNVFYFYNGTQVQPLGVCQLNVTYKNRTEVVNFYVMRNGGPLLLGRDFLNKFAIRFEVGYVNNKFEDMQLSKLLAKYHSVFDGKLGRFTIGIATLKLINKDVTPKFCKPRPVPYAIRSQVEGEINRLVSVGILKPVDYSEWATPVVPVFKKDGTVRLCGDYRTTINSLIEVDQYPIPKIDDLFGRMQGGVRFTKLDLGQAYQQVELDEDSQNMVTLSTHKGLFKQTRLPFGVASAPAKFQKIMESLFCGMDGVVVFLDDILITGKNDKEHLKRLELVLQKLNKAGLKVKSEKCKFFESHVEYLGFIIDAEGLHPCEAKVKAIAEFPCPENYTQLKSFLGLVNYYGKFVRNMSDLLQPLYSLLKKDAPWVWSSRCSFAFDLNT